MKKKYRNKLTIYCNFVIPPIKNTRVHCSHTTLKFADKCRSEVLKYLNPDNKYKTFKGLEHVIDRYLELCTVPLEDNATRDEDNRILYNWNMENLSFTPAIRKRFLELVYDAISTGLDGKHIRLNTNWETAINTLRYYVFKGKFKSTDVSIIYNDNGERKTFRINKDSKFIDSNNEVVELPSGFFDTDLDELLKMMR